MTAAFNSEGLVPRWVEIEAELGFIHWRMTQLLNEVKSADSPLDVMIDEASGRLDAIEKETNELIARSDELLREREHLDAG